MVDIESEVWIRGVEYIPGNKIEIREKSGSIHKTNLASKPIALSLPLPRHTDPEFL